MPADFASGNVINGGMYFLGPEGAPRVSYTGRVEVVSNFNTSRVGLLADSKLANRKPPFQVPMSSGDSVTSAANSEAVIYLPVPGYARNHVLDGLTFGYSSTPSAGSFLEIQSPSGTSVYKSFVNSAGSQDVNFNSNKVGANNSDVLIRLTAGGSNVTGCISINNRRIE